MYFFNLSSYKNKRINSGFGYGNKWTIQQMNCMEVFK